MKTNRLATILTSAYLSAMLATSVAPIRSDATLAAAIDPMAAQKAFQNAVIGLDAAGWLAASTAGTPPAAQATPAPVPAKNPASKADPVMTEELMMRMVIFAQSNEEIGSVRAKMCKILNLCDGTENMPLRLLKGDLTDADHYFAIPLDPKSKDILIMVEGNKILTAYLTDKTGKLRAAGVLQNGVAHLVTNESVAEKFAAELKQYAKEAGDLPPTGTAAAGNS